jgi:hypothetical protein
VLTKIFLRTPSEDSEEFRRARAFCRIFSGVVPAVFYTSDTKEYRTPAETVNPTPFVIGELKEILGEENVVLR